MIDIDDYEELEDLFLLYQEARKQVDEEYPRGDIQARMALKGYQRWFEAHNFWSEMMKCLDDRPFNVNMSLFVLED